MLHAIILGGIGFVLALAGCFMMWKLGNHWYPIALVVTALPCTWLGGKLAFALGARPRALRLLNIREGSRHGKQRGCHGENPGFAAPFGPPPAAL